MLLCILVDPNTNKLLNASTESPKNNIGLNGKCFYFYKIIELKFNLKHDRLHIYSINIHAEIFKHRPHES